MTDSSNPGGEFKNIQLLFKNLHFWVLLIITSFLVLIYQFWPWRDFQFQNSWQWLAWLSPLDQLAIREGIFRCIGSLFILPCIYASIVFHLRGSVIMAVISLLALLPVMLSMWQTPETWLINIVYLLLPVILTVIISVELRLRSREKIYYMELAKERQLHLSKVIDAQEKARQSIAREIHDESIQTLLATASHTEKLRTLDNLEEIKAKSAWIEKNIRSTVVELRRISLDLRSTILDDLGLVSAIRWLIDQPALKDFVQVQINNNGEGVILPPEIELAAFRIIQEALNNIKNHAQAQNAVITLKFTPQLLTILIRDDGQGFKVPKRITSLALTGKLGLIDIQERAQLFGGKLVVNSKVNSGTLLTVEIPLPVPQG